MRRRFAGSAALLALTFAAAASAQVRAGDAPLTIIAHRGASWDAPEHTFAAWDLALAGGADWIELDVQLTRDGVLVVFHDDTLERTARGPADACTGRLADRTRAELARCEVGSWFNDEHPERARADFAGARIATVAEVLERYAGRARFYIETKRPDEAPGMNEALLELLRRHRLAGPGTPAGRVIIQSFSAPGLARIRSLDAALPLVQLLDDRVEPDSLPPLLDRVARTAQGIGPSRRILSRRMVERAHERGLFVHAYTVNDPAVLAWVRGIGVDGVFTDRPGMVRAQLGR